MANTKNTTRIGGKRWPWIVGTLIAVAVLFTLITDEPAVPSDFATVTRGPLQVTLDEEGETRVRDRYVVSAPLAGRLLRIELEPGDPVIADETVLATFQPTPPALLDARAEAEAEARVRAATSALGRARAEQARAASERDFALTDLDRQKRLAAEEVVSPDALDRAELEVERGREGLRAADFAVATAEHELAVARAALTRTRGGADDAPIELTAPVDGVVLRRLRESETVVPAGEPLLEVADPEQLEIVSDYLSTDAVKIEPGQKVLIEQWGGDHALHATVRRVEPSGFTKISALGVEEQRVNVVLDFDDSRDAWQKLGDGFRVENRVIIWSSSDVLKVPTSALFRDDAGNWAVFVVDADVAVRTAVEVGERDGLEAEVRNGLSEGQSVVIHPSDVLGDGMKVATRGS
ncbi:MAG: efflux RND transporter periplasmic adaptor subunit [Acidobacteriota bacterium]